jgi:hypothetical protein
MKRQRQKPIIASGRIQLVAKLINLSPGMGTQLLSGGHQGEVVMDPADDHAEKQTKHAYNSLCISCVRAQNGPEAAKLLFANGSAQNRMRFSLSVCAHQLIIGLFIPCHRRS